MMRVVERYSRQSCGWNPSPGLDGIPAELTEHAARTIATANARLGWIKYMIIPDLAAYEACLRTDGDNA